ncbi:hypothetical protein RHGRI_021595 [Rhododendron griersonianum]|uniref:Uncharacterized protein n=1 Tax=Rhododendron griersonianum TaxID=479676 RepID=A0AAV6JM52_9ERIC|nr:hypothetical protein RHGRI_021595 [Rhododendron griersonianum]
MPFLLGKRLRSDDHDHDAVNKDTVSKSLPLQQLDHQRLNPSLLQLGLEICILVRRFRLRVRARCLHSVLHRGSGVVRRETSARSDQTWVFV